MNFFHRYKHSMFYTKNMCTCMHAIQDVRSCECMQPPWAFTWTRATTQVKRVDMLYLGTYMEGGRYFGWALLRTFMVVGLGLSIWWERLAEEQGNLAEEECLGDILLAALHESTKFKSMHHAYACPQ